MSTVLELAVLVLTGFQFFSTSAKLSQNMKNDKGVSNDSLKNTETKRRNSSSLSLSRRPNVGSSHFQDCSY
jgi:hypothetical protein